MDSFDLRLWDGFAEAGGNIAEPAIVDQITTDTRRIDSPNSLFVALQGQQSDGHDFVEKASRAGTRFALVKKGWLPSGDIGPIQLLHVSNPLRAFQDIAAAYRMQMPCKVIAITGSYGKTMVKDLLLTMLSTTKKAVASPESFNSQIGVPLSLLTISKDHEIAIIEAGISLKEEMDILKRIIKPDYAILTHLGKKHRTTLGDMATVADEMLKLLQHPDENGWVLIPKDPLIQASLSKITSQPFYWDSLYPELPHATALPVSEKLVIPYRVDFPDHASYLGQMTTGFYYYLDLINMTSKAAWKLGIPYEAICSTLNNYAPEPMRTEIWKSSLGATFINDTYCSDPQSVDLSLRNLVKLSSPGRKIFLFGGLRGENPHLSTDLKRIGQAIGRSSINLLILHGNMDYTGLIKEVDRQSPLTQIIQATSFYNALEKYKQILHAEDAVLIKGAKKESLEKVIEMFQDSVSTNQCIVNLAAIQENINSIRNRLPEGNRIMVMVKAMAYGTDDVRMAKFLNSCGVDVLGVSYVDEGVALRRGGVTQSIFVINAASYEAAKIVKWDLEVGVDDIIMIETLAAEAEKYDRVLKVHLHVDTGMSRFGCRPEDAISLAKIIHNCSSLKLEGVMTHFACAENPLEDEFTLKQAKMLEDIIIQLKEVGIDPPWKHAANSSAAIRFHFPQFNLVRLGLAVYGLSASPTTRNTLELRLAVSLLSRIVGINRCKTGDTISYGRGYTVKKDEQRIAVLPIGYFDGLHRSYSGKGHVMIRGQKAPMVGKICMDFMMVDITDIPFAQVGDPVLVFGEDEYGHYLSPEDLAIRGDSIVYELITCLGPRIQRLFVYEEANNKTHTS